MDDKIREILDTPIGTLKHFGIPGMKWGVRKKRQEAVSENDQASSSQKRNRLASELISVKRQIDWKKKTKDYKKMSDDEIKNVTERIKNENTLKRLAKRKEYVMRDKLSDKQLKDRVDRLQLEDNLKRNISVASKTQREIGKKIAESSMKIGLAIYNDKKSNKQTDITSLIKAEMLRHAKTSKSIGVKLASEKVFGSTKTTEPTP